MRFVYGAIFIILSGCARSSALNDGGGTAGQTEQPRLSAAGIVLRPNATGDIEIFDRDVQELARFRVESAPKGIYGELLAVQGGRNPSRTLRLRAGNRIIAEGEELFLSAPSPSGTPSVLELKVIVRPRPGTPYDSFGDHGLLPLSMWLSDVAEDPLGRLITVSDHTIERWNEDGTPDVSFGETGIVTSPAAFSGWSVLISNDRVLVCGAVETDYVPNTKLAVLALRPDGRVDTTFGSQGLATFDYNPSENDLGYSIAEDSSHRIVVGGSTAYGVLIVRFNADGSVDKSFGESGAVFHAYSGHGSESAMDVAIDSQGRIVIADDSGWLGRFLSDGSIDYSFGDGGAAEFGTSPRPAVHASPRSLDIGPAGIAVAGFDSLHSPLILHLSSDGKPETSFGAGGYVTFPGIWGLVTDALFYADGRTTLIGGLNPLDSDGNDRFSVAALAPDGTAAADFGIEGLATYSLAPPSRPVNLARLHDGTLVVVGYGGMMRLWADP